MIIKFEPLKSDSLYMNTFTGTVDTGGNRMEDFISSIDFPDLWRQWGGNSLIEVKSDEEGSWIEVE